MHCFSKASCLGVKLIIITIQEVTGYNIFFIHMIPRLSCQEWCALAAAQVTYLHGWYSGKFTPTPSSLVTSPSDLSQLVHIPLPFSDLIWDAGNLRGYSAYTPPSISYLQVIHSPKHIHPLASPPHALPNGKEMPGHWALWERSLLTLWALNHSLLRGPVLAVVLLPPFQSRSRMVNMWQSDWD